MAVCFHTEECGFRLKEKRKIARWVKQCIATKGFGEGVVTFVFCSSEYHIGINRQYLGHDYYTDVITFDYGDNLPHGIISGDILIDQETVRSNAALNGVPFEQELLRVIIHGILHLCGYKDKTDGQAAEMRAKEDFYLAEF